MVTLNFHDFELSAHDGSYEGGVFVICPWGGECPVDNNNDVCLVDAETVGQAVEWTIAHIGKHEAMNIAEATWRNK